MCTTVARIVLFRGQKSTYSIGEAGYGMGLS